MASNGGSRKRLAVKIAKTAKTGVVWVANDDVIENFDFEKLARSNEVTGDFDVRLGWSRLTRYSARGISGDPSPSEADIKVTRDLIRAGQLLKIEVLDHVILGKRTEERPRDFISLREAGYFYS